MEQQPVVEWLYDVEVTVVEEGVVFRCGQRIAGRGLVDGGLGEATGLREGPGGILGGHGDGVEVALGLQLRLHWLRQGLCQFLW